MIRPAVEVTDTLIKISFPYDAELVEKVRTIPRARWVSGERVWTVPYSETSLDLVRSVLPNMQYKEQTIKKLEQKELTDIEIEELKYLPTANDKPVKDFVFKTQPFTHQKVTFSFTRALDCSAIFLEQGLGKAKAAIDLATWRFRKKQIRRCFVVCPVYVMTQWLVEIDRHGHDDFKNYILLEGSSAKRQKLLEELPAEWAGFIIINYDGLLPLREYLLRRQLSSNKIFEMMVLDESSKIKHAQSMRSKLSWRLGLTVKYRNIMTGTPITQTIEDIFSQYRFLNASIFGPYATAFRAQFLVMGGFENREIIGYKNVAALMKRIYSVAIRFTKDRCLDIPPKIYERREARLDAASTSKYLEFEKRCVAEFDGKTISAQLVMTKLMKLSQITGGFIYEQGPDGKKIGTIRLATNPKLHDLAELLEEVLPKKVIVWYRFEAEREMLVELLKKLRINFVAIGKGVSKEDKKTAVSTFQNDDKCKLFLANVTAGIGITLTKAEVVIYYSNSYSYEDRIQSEDRCHRIGLDHKVTYIDMVAVLANGRKTIDSDVLLIKDGKERLANQVSAALMQRMVTRAGAKTDFRIDERTNEFSNEEEF